MFPLLLVACTTPVEPEDVATPTAPVSTPDPDEPAEDVDFTPGAMIEVVVTMDDADFESLRVETRNGFELLSDDCLAEPFGSPFTWYEADVQLDGRPVDRVGIRKKGFLGSLNEERPSLKLKLDKYVDDQTLGDTERVTLNNQVSDPGKVRSCLSYAMFEAAGVPAPRCNFAHVQVNDEDLGVYVHVEAVKRDFLERAFGGSDGHLYEGTLSDFRAGWTNTFDAKTDTTDPSGAPLDGLVSALEQPDETLLDALEPVLDLDAFIAFWAAEILTAHWDGYAMNTNNFYVYVGADGRARFVPWGTDGVLFDLREPGDDAEILQAGEIGRRLLGLPSTRQALATELERQLDLFDEEAILDEIDALETTLTPSTLEPLVFRDQLDDVRDWITRRRGQIEVTIADLPDAEPAPSAPICFQPDGSVDWSFQTTFTEDFSGYSIGDPAEFEVSGQVFTLTDTITVAGIGDDGQPVVATFGTAAPGVTGQLIFSTPSDQFEPGAVTLNFSESVGWVVLLDEITEEVLFQGIVDAEVSLDAANVSEGASIAGSVQGEMYPLF